MSEYTLLMKLDHASKDLAESLYNFGKDWPLFRDHKFKLIDLEEYEAMVTRGELPNSDYWNVRKYGLVMLKSGTNWNETCEKLKQGLSDYMDGWNAAMRKAVPSIEVGRLHHPWMDEKVQTCKRPKRMKLGRITA